MGTPTKYLCDYWSRWVRLPRFGCGPALILVLQLVGPLETPPSGTPALLPIPLPTPSPPLLLPSTDCRAGVSDVTLPPWKRLCITLGPRFEVGESSSAPTARPTGDFKRNYRFIATLDDEIRQDPERDVELRMLRWTCGRTMLDMIPNGVYRAELEVKNIIDKIRERRLRWFGHVRRRPRSTPVRKVEDMARCSRPRSHCVLLLDIGCVYHLRYAYSLFVAPLGGRLTLLKSVLGSIAIYYMSIFKTPIAVIKELEVIRNKFFLGADADANKMTWVKWNKVMASKKDGVHAGSIWINILKVSCELEKKNVHLDDFLKRKVDDGLETRLDLAPNAPFLRRNLRGGAEKEQWVALLSLLETHVSSNQGDRWIWTGDGDGIYSVKCGRNLIDKGTLCLDTYATRWLKEMPAKVNIFIWRMLLNKLPTLMNLMTRGITVQSNKCGICDTGDETINHLMLHCDLAWDVWALVGRWWSLDFPSVLTIRELLSWVDDTRLHTLAKVLHVVVGTTAWSIWNFRNRNVFQEEKPKKALLFDSIVSTSFFWLSNRNNKFRINWIGFLQDPIMTCNTL
ncbi:RNA-directed DNA polymerase, eukaryota [Tanacetum coccineum]